MLVLETIDLNGVQSFKALTNKLKLNNVLPSNVIIWKLRNNNPMRKSYNNKKISFEEFDALTTLASEMSKYLYTYIREILQKNKDISVSDVIIGSSKTYIINLFLAILELIKVREIDFRQTENFSDIILSRI